MSNHELFANEDLTENDIIIRQINCSGILNRLLTERIDNPTAEKSDFNFEIDFYGRENRWTSFGALLKIFSFLYIILYGPCKLLISFLWIFSPLSKLNTVIQLKKKAENFRKVRYYITLLKEKMNGTQYFDYHFYKMSIYMKLASLIV